MYLQHVKPHCKPKFVIHYCALCWLSCFSWKEAFWKNKFLVFPRSYLSSHDWNHLAASVMTTHKCCGRSAILNTSFCVSSHRYLKLYTCDQLPRMNCLGVNRVCIRTLLQLERWIKKNFKVKLVFDILYLDYVSCRKQGRNKLSALV